MRQTLRSLLHPISRSSVSLAQCSASKSSLAARFCSLAKTDGLPDAVPFDGHCRWDAECKLSSTVSIMSSLERSSTSLLVDFRLKRGRFSCETTAPYTMVLFWPWRSFNAGNRMRQAMMNAAILGIRAHKKHGCERCIPFI